MKYDPAIHHRRSIRLKGYDYAQAGAYFVTIVTQHREFLFGEVREAAMHLSAAGEMIHADWLDLSKRFSNVDLDEFVVMPNHIHGIIVITHSVGASLVDAPDGDAADWADTRPAPTDAPLRAGTRPAPTDALDGDALKRASTRPAPTKVRLGDIVGAFKSITTDDYIVGVHESNWRSFDAHLWQRGYYEHIIRNEQDLDRIREYIINNPAQWHADTEYPLVANG